VRRYVFTGPSSINKEQEQFVRDVVRRLSPPPSEITTGAADGVDTISCLEGLEAWPTALHRVVVPVAPHNEGLIEALEIVNQDGQFLGNERVQILRMPYIHGDDEANRRRRAYRARNRHMLEFGDELIALLRSMSPYRSGELMTMNIAADLNVPVFKILLP